MHAVAEAARKVACTGATPVAATNCLNFGNPEKPETMAQFSATIDGIAEACTALGTPITGGNVSLYNETKGEGIYPTPVIGVVGILDDVTKAVPASFQRSGDAILLLVAGRQKVTSTTDVRSGQLQEFGSSEFARTCLNQLWGKPPMLDIRDEARLHHALKELADADVLSSASDVSDGGLAVSIAEASIKSGLGASIELHREESQFHIGLPSHVLYGEDASRAVVTCPESLVPKVQAIAERKYAIKVHRIGHTQRHLLEIGLNAQPVISAPISDLEQPWATALESNLHDQTANEVLA